MKQSTNKVEFILDEYEYFEDLYIENGASDVRLVKTKRPNVRVVADNLSKYRVFFSIIPIFEDFRPQAPAIARLLSPDHGRHFQKPSWRCWANPNCQASSASGAPSRQSVRA